MVGPVLAVIIVCAVIHVIRGKSLEGEAPAEPNPWIEQDGSAGASPSSLVRRNAAVRCISSASALTFFAFNLIISFVTKVQVNWPAPAYFTLMILAAWFLATRLRDVRTWRRWRGWFWGTIVHGARDDADRARYVGSLPAGRQVQQHLSHEDPAGEHRSLRELRGWRSWAIEVSLELRSLGDRPFVLCDDYMQTAETAFYVEGQPTTYYAGSYYADAKRFTQYDMWPNRRLDQPELSAAMRFMSERAANSVGNSRGV